MYTISAISTAPGVGGVAIIRVSGEEAFSVAEKMFRPLGKTEVRDFEPYKLYVGEIDCGSFTDFGMCVLFKAPRSYTGEDMAEFHCHGGYAVTQGVLKRTFDCGATPATKGEFTKRAFLNGKLSLSACEGLVDMINSESEAEVKAGYSLYRERLNAKVVSMQEKLTYALALVDAGMDYPEEGVAEDNEDEVVGILSEVREETESLISTYSSGRKIKNGVKVAIVGKPNVGKSSVLNGLLNYDKAIVSSVAGTTRDVVEGEIDLEGVRFLFSDTAGIRDSEDEIEAMGIKKSRGIIAESDLVLVVLDGSEELTDEDKKILFETEGKNRIIAVNKIDKNTDKDIIGDLYVSAKTGEGFDELRRKLFEKTFGGKIDAGADMLTEERHLIALKKASLSLKDAIDNFSAVAEDACAIDMREAWRSLGEISGESADEKIIGEIFSKFCVGK